MEDFDHFRVVQYGEEGFQFNSGRQRVNDGGCVRRGDLNQAEFGVVRFFAQEFQIYGNEKASGSVPDRSLSVPMCFQSVS